MIEPYSLDLRKRAVDLLDEEASSPEVAEMLGVSISWVRMMRLRLGRLGHLEPGSPPGRERKVSLDGEAELWILVAEQPDATLEELVEMVAKRIKVRVSISTLSPDRVGPDAEKDSARHRSERPEIQLEREQFLRRSVVRRATRLLFIDETGINLSMTRTHARNAAGIGSLTPCRRTGATTSP